MRQYVLPSNVVTIGFRWKAMVDDLVGIINERLHFLHKWGCSTQAWIGSLDIETAFEQMKHQFIAQALTARGIPAHYVAACMREMENHMITLEAPTASETTPTELTSGGIQGGAPHLSSSVV